jgi:hypothetical protein
MDTDAVLVGDCVRVLAGLPPGMPDLAYANPPSNQGIDYPGCEDRRTPKCE